MHCRVTLAAMRSAVASFSVLLLSTASLVVNLGCTDVRTLVVTAPKPPADFSVDVTILTGSAAKDLDQIHRRQGKLTVLADGSLHSDFGNSLGFTTRPLPTRWLYQQQLDGLWRLAGDEGWLNPAQSSADVWPGSIRPLQDEIVYILFFHAEGNDWWFVRRTKVADAQDPHAVVLVRSLCDLAWGSDRSADRHLPHRYDFGPNPYEGFAKAPPFSWAKPNAVAP